MAMVAWAETTPAGWRDKMRRWRSTGAESLGAAVTIPTLIEGSGDDGFNVGILAMRGNVSGLVTTGGTQGFRISTGLGAAPLNVHDMLGPDGLADRISASEFDTGKMSPLFWASLGTAAVPLNHILAWQNASIVYDQGTNAGGTLNWLELWHFPALPGAGSALPLR